MQELQEFVRYILLSLKKSPWGAYLFSVLRKGIGDGEAYFKS